MKYYIFFLVALNLFFISCSNKKLPLPPDKFIVEKKTSFETALDKVTIYQLKYKAFDVKLLSEYPENFTNYYTVKWIKFKDYQTSERKKILKTIEESNQSDKSKKLSALLTLLKINKSIYFSAYYTTMYYNESDIFRFYEKIFFFDVENKNIYEIKPIENP